MGFQLIKKDSHKKNEYKEKITDYLEKNLEKETTNGCVKNNGIRHAISGNSESLGIILKEKFNLATYYQPYTHDKEADDVDDPSNKFNDLALSAVWIPSYNLVLKFEYHYVNGTALLSDADNDEFIDSNGDYENDSWSYFVTKMSFSF